LFFFSSRSRHTRFSRDWSSDVCSSDLSGNLRVIPPWTLARTVAHRYSGAADPWRPDLPLRPAVRPATGRTQSHGHSRVAAGRALLHAGELGAGGGKGEGIFAGGLRLIAQPAALPHPLPRGGGG